MAGLFDKQAETYLDYRPTYPTDWYAMLAELTAGNRSLAWDVGTGNGQAAVGLAEHYEKVIATDISLPQLNFSKQHPRVEYHHTPISMSDDDLVALIGGEGSVDLITVAQAVHWFDLPRFYSIVARLLRKPGGVIAVWGYNHIVLPPELDSVMKRFYDTTLPFWSPKIQHLIDGYKNLSFPFENVGLGSEGNPLVLDIPKELSFDGLLGMVRSWSAVNTAKGKGVDLLPESMVKEIQIAWGDVHVRPVVYKAFMLAGTPKSTNIDYCDSD